MTNLYVTSPTKWQKYTPSPKSDSETAKIQIADGFSAHCTKNLLQIVQKLNRDITRAMVTDLIMKGKK